MYNIVNKTIVLLLEHVVHCTLSDIVDDMLPQMSWTSDARTLMYFMHCTGKNSGSENKIYNILDFTRGVHNSTGSACRTGRVHSSGVPDITFFGVRVMFFLFCFPCQYVFLDFVMINTLFPSVIQSISAIFCITESYSQTDRPRLVYTLHSYRHNDSNLSLANIVNTYFNCTNIPKKGASLGYVFEEERCFTFGAEECGRKPEDLFSRPVNGDTSEFIQ